MPTKLLERGLGPIVLLGALAGAALPASAQPAPADAVSAPEATAEPAGPAAPPRTHLIQPTLNVQATATSNSELARGGSQAGKSEMILSVIPGIGFQVRGAQSELVGQFQLEGLRYVRGTQSDRVLPSGDLRLKLEAVKDSIGVDTTLHAHQVRADTTAQQLSNTSAANSYTDTTLHVMPYFRARLDSYSMLEVRFDRGVLNSTENSSELSGTQRDAYTSDDLVRVLRRASPLGYEVQLRDRTDRYKGAQTAALEQREASYALLMAPNPELTFGLKLLRSQDRIQGRLYTDTSLGYQAEWRPTARTVLLAQTENRSYGRTWMTDFQHRWRWVTAGLRAERIATSYARESARNPVSTLPLTPEQTPAPNGGRQDLTQPFETGAQIRQALQGRMTIMGRRNQVNLMAGHIRSASLVALGNGEVGAGGNRTREHYFETELTHQLTPSNSITGGFRWARSQAVQALTGEDVVSRDFVARAAFSTRLSLDTTATVGLRRQITHSNPTTSANETAGFVGLGHRF